MQVKLSPQNINTIKIDDVLYNWRTHEYCRCKTPYDSHRQCQRITVGQLSDSESIWWTSYISLKRISDWRLIPDFDEEN